MLGYFVPCNINNDVCHYWCCICHHGFESTDGDRTTRHRWRKYTAIDLMNKYFKSKHQWWPLYRMIIYTPRTQHFLVSGVTYHIREEGDDMFVPRDPEMGSVDYCGRETCYPLVVKSSDDPFMPYSRAKVYGYPVHARCWELLCSHKLGDIAQTDLGLVVQMLRWGDLNWKNRVGPSCQSFDFPSAEDEDPKSSGHIRSLINRARRRTKKRFLPRGGFDPTSRLCRLPLEVLCMIGRYLPAKEAAAVQEVTNTYFGDTYWRHRTPTYLFPEARAVKDEVELLDWEFLCLGLEKLRLDPGELITRKHIMRELDACLDYDPD